MKTTYKIHTYKIQDGKTTEGTAEVTGYVYNAYGVRVGISREGIDARTGKVIQYNKWFITELTTGDSIHPNYARAFNTRKAAEREIGIAQHTWKVCGKPTWERVKEIVASRKARGLDLNPDITPDTEIYLINPAWYECLA